MQERADDDAGDQITEHGAKPELAENGGRDDCAGQKQQWFGKESVVLGHAGGLSNRVATKPSEWRKRRFALDAGLLAQ
ncbi:hypothetical protein D3C87_593790 [compost metagenome]